MLQANRFVVLYFAGVNPFICILCLCNKEYLSTIYLLVIEKTVKSYKVDSLLDII